MNLLDLLYQRGIQLRKAGTTHGGEYQGPCPCCGGTDRFHAWPEQNTVDKSGRPVSCSGRYWCRPGLGHCGKAGDAIQFVIDYDHLSFKEACARLGQRMEQVDSHRYPAKPHPVPGWQPVDREAPAMSWAEAAKKLVFWAYEQIFEHTAALDYLQGRGIREETLLTYGLGWNPGKNGQGLYKSREAWGLLAERSEKTGKPRPLWLPIGWVIPYIQGDQVVRVRIRQLDGAEFGPRYYMVPGSSSATMVIEPRHPGYRDVYVIVEAELDAILIAQEASDLVGVMALGSSSTRPDKIATEKLNRAAHILNALDADGAGEKESGKWWRENYPDAERWPVPEGKDPGEAWQKGVDIREWVMEGLPEGLRSAALEERPPRRT
jgi:hypothetical protein